MKIELENQKKYGLQLSSSLHKNQRRKSRIMSSSYKVNPNINNNNNINSFSSSYLFRITHFSHYFPRNKLSKKAKAEIDEKAIQKLKDELDSCKQNFEKN